MPPNNTPDNSPDSNTPPQIPNLPLNSSQQSTQSTQLQQANTPSPTNQAQPTAPYSPTQTSPSTPYDPNSNISSKKTNKKTVIGIIIGVILLVVLPIIALVIYLVVVVFGEASAVTKASNGFISAMTKGDVTTALTYTDGKSDTKKFLEGMASGVKATNFKITGTKSVNHKWSILYSLNGASNNSARTDLEKDQNSKNWQIVGFYTGQNLSLSGAEVKNEVAEINPTPLPQLVSAEQCLVQSDFDNWYKTNLGLGKTATETGLHYEDPITAYSTNVHFPADSLDYQGFDPTNSVASFASLVTDPAISNKTFLIHLYGSVGTSSADKDFANKRAEKVKTDLIAKGVPADKIILDAPKSVTDMGDTSSVSRGSARNVVMKFDPTCSGNSSTGR